jgi:hypothetical protein
MDTDLSGHILPYKATEYFPEVLRVFLIEHLEHEEAIVCDTVLALRISGE